MIDYREKEENGNVKYKSEEFYSEGGLREFVNYLDSSREKLIAEPIYIRSDKTNVPISHALVMDGIRFHDLSILKIRGDKDQRFAHTFTWPN